MVTGSIKETDSKAEYLSRKLDFINRNTDILISSTHFEKAVNSVLKSILEYYHADRSYVFEINRTQHTVTNTFEICADGIKPDQENLQNMPVDVYLSGWIEGFNKDGYVNIPSVDEIERLDGFCVPDYKQRLLECGLHSILCAAFYEENQLSGFIGVDNHRICRDDADFLVTMAKFISAEMIKRRINEEYKIAAQKNQLILDSIPGGACLLHIQNQTVILDSVNEGYYRSHPGNKSFWQQFLGKSAILDRFQTSDRKLFLNELINAGKDPENALINFNYHLLDEEGNTHFFNMQARYAYCNSQGTYYYASVTNLDKQMIAELQAKNVGRQIIDQINQLPTIGALLYMDADGICESKFFTEGFCQMVQSTPETVWDMYKSNILDAVHPEDREKLRRFMMEHIHDKFPYHSTYRLRRPDNSYIWVSSNFANFTAAEIPYIYAVYTDISADKEKEALIEKRYFSEVAFLNSVSENYLCVVRANLTKNRIEEIKGAEPAVSTDLKDGSYASFIKDAAASILNKTEREQFVKTYSREELLKHDPNHISDLKVSYYSQRLSGQRCWTEMNLHLVQQPDDKDLIALITERDISQEKTFDILIKEILIRQYDFLVIIDGENRSVSAINVNQRHSQVRVIRAGDIYDESMKEFSEKYLVPEEKQAFINFMLLESVQKGLNDNDSYSSSFHIMENDEIHYKHYDFYYLDRDSQLIVLIRRDFTEIQAAQMKQESDLQTALAAAQQASLAKTEFLSRMSHEIRTPMNAIIGLDTIALQEKGLSSAMEDHLTKIGISARFLLSLINDILDMSRIESGKMMLKQEEFDFKRLIDSINTILYNQCSEKGIEYECILKGWTEERYIGDLVKLQQILVNILGNSVKFTPAGGKIHFMVEQLSHDKEKARLRFTITDTGIGIDKEFLPHLFEAFTQENRGNTSAYGGSGLGLAISKSIAELMGGTINVHSVKNVGSEFTIEVNLGLNSKSVFWNGIQNYQNIKKLDTLVVDDDEVVCLHTKIVLEQAGFSAEWVTNGTEAVKSVANRHVSRKDFDLILLDWKMPEMSGVQTAQEIRKIVGPEITIIIMTAYDWTNIEEEAKKAGVDAFIRKPVFVSNLLNTYSEVLSSRACRKEKLPTEDFDFSGKNILLAEDNAINAEIAVQLLEMKGSKVDTAGNGVEAVEMFTTAEVGYYSVILMDVRMPIMDGLTATRTIRALKKKDSKTIPIIAMSANAFDEDIRNSIESGMNAHLTKPIEPELLYTTLKKFIQ